MWQKLGRLLSSTPDLAGALRAFEQAVAVAPQIAETHGNLAVLLLRAEDYSRARTELLKAVEIDPNDPYGWYNLALAEVNLGLLSEGRSSLQEAVRVGGASFAEMARRDANLSPVVQALKE